MTAVDIARQRWHVIVPLVALPIMALTWGRGASGLLVAFLGLLLAGAVLAAVHYAEVIARRVGEPFGSLVLAVAVTIIEVGLIVTLMLSSDGTKTTLARDTVFAALMITCNGIVGISLLVATLRRKEVRFSAEGSGAALATIGTLAALSLVLPTFTVSSPGPTFTPPQLMFAAAASLGLYLLFVFVQTVRDRESFLPTVEPRDDGRPDDAAADDDFELHGPPVSNRQAGLGLVMLVIALVGVVGLAKLTSPAIEGAVRDAGLPSFVVAVAIALLVLLPESITAVRAAALGRTQVSLNLAYGSAMASIGLTVPVIAALSLMFGYAVTLGLSATEIVLLVLTLFIGTLTVTPGRATLLQGGVHLAVFAGFLVVTLIP